MKNTKSSKNRLPLLWSTPPEWATQVLREPLQLLSDHAYLERKAASNALELLNRWPEPFYPDTWVPTLAGIARDEALHLNQVTALLKKRGGKLERKHRNSYAFELRKRVRMGYAKEELMDRLLISALIEARSCERFGLLAKKATDRELKSLYKGLWSSELGHYTVFLKLAAFVLPKDKMKKRWAQLLKDEAQILQKEPVGPRMHSGFLS